MEVGRAEWGRSQIYEGHPNSPKLHRSLMDQGGRALPLTELEGKPLFFPVPAEE